MQERLKLFLESGVINEQVYSFSMGVVSALKAEGFAESEMETFITHLAVSAMRTLKGESVQCDADAMTAELKDDVGEECYAQAMTLWEKLSREDIQYDARELCYIMLHLCTMISGKNDR